MNSTVDVEAIEQCIESIQDGIDSVRESVKSFNQITKNLQESYLDWHAYNGQLMEDRMEKTTGISGGTPDIEVYGYRATQSSGTDSGGFYANINHDADEIYRTLHSINEYLSLALKSAQTIKAQQEAVDDAIAEELAGSGDSGDSSYGGSGGYGQVAGGASGVSSSIGSLASAIGGTTGGHSASGTGGTTGGHSASGTGGTSSPSTSPSSSSSFSGSSSGGSSTTSTGEADDISGTSTDTGSFSDDVSQPTIIDTVGEGGTNSDGTHTGGGYSGSTGYVGSGVAGGTGDDDNNTAGVLRGAATSIDDIIRGKDKNKIASSSAPVIGSDQIKGSSVIPVVSGLGAVGASGLGLTAMMGHGKDDDDDDDIEEYDETKMEMEDVTNRKDAAFVKTQEELDEYMNDNNSSDSVEQQHGVPEFSESFNDNLLV